MEQHAVPRQITTFEFKLIGFLTLRQFLYLAVFSAFAFILFALIPVPLFNILAAASSAFAGVALAFLPVNERPLDIWIKNFVKKLLSPSQYYYQKKNRPPAFLKGVRLQAEPEVVANHLEAKDKLNAYVSRKKKKSSTDGEKKRVSQMISFPQTKPATEDKKRNYSPLPKRLLKSVENKANKQAFSDDKPTPFLFGLVKNSQGMPLPGVLVYIKDKSEKLLRILKTNSQGVFATFKFLPPGPYALETKDTAERHFFDTMEVRVGKKNEQPFVITSREVL